MKAFVVSGTHSGCGKTTVSLALMAALVRRGYRVAPFKVGPDFIDPSHHRQVCGHPSYNLDQWMIPLEENKRFLQRAAHWAQMAVVEGVMGLFDGASAREDTGSTAALAKALGLPVILVVDARRQARSIAALIRGFEAFDPRLQLAGVILNQVGSKRHESLLSEAIETYCQIKLLGALPRREDLSLPSRHLGLVDAGSFHLGTDLLDRLAHWVEEGVDLDRLLSLAKDISPGPFFSSSSDSGPLVAYAFDEAFSFYYQANLEALSRAGARLRPFSPLREGLPPETRAVYLGGGYPELFADVLTENKKILHDLRQAAASGIPIYAECGGFMFLCRGLRQKGRLIPWAGIFPFEVEMGQRYRALGYREVLFLKDNFLGPVGCRARGHEFHYSHLLGHYQGPRIYRLFDARGRELGTEGFLREKVLGSYVHLHFASNPLLASSLVAAAQG